MEPVATQKAPESAWNDSLLRNPHAAADKRTRVQRMFAAIAPSYDLNNRLHSFWQDQRWRRKAVKLADFKSTDQVVDVACGTGDLTLTFWRRLWEIYGFDDDTPHVGQILGVDFTYEMLPRANRKVRRLFTRNRYYQDIAPSDVQFINGDAQSLPLLDSSADVVSIAFGIRNVADPSVALREFYRVLRPGGRVIILEFSQPTNRVLRWLNDLYCCRIMPHTATWISRDRTGAYKYLPQSIRTFIGREQMMQMMRDAGFVEVQQFPMTFGVCVCYRGIKK
jgi:demethylmenaquinone methyltransferase/2-methoxy-6-polyprenyl-1,4-benzoquinol methylase